MDNFFLMLEGEMNRFLSFRKSYALEKSLILKEVIIDLLNKQYNSSIRFDPQEIIDKQYESWKTFSESIVQAQFEYLGPELERGKNKAHHSLEVAYGVSFLFEQLSVFSGHSVNQKELDYIRFRGLVHDSGRILNLSENTLNKTLSELDNQSPREIVLPAATSLYCKYGSSLGDLDDLQEAICYLAISNRTGVLYQEAASIDPHIKKLQNYFHRKDVHNPLYLDGLYNFTAHHNKPNSSVCEAENYNGTSNYGIIDQLAIMVDKASACTGGAYYLDEIALHLLYYSDIGACDKSYIRFFLENYGTKVSLIEQWFLMCIEKECCRVPNAINKFYVDFDSFTKALRGCADGEVNFPRMFGSWSPFPSKASKMALATELSSFSSVAEFISNRVSNFPVLTKEMVYDDIKVSREFYNSRAITLL